MCICCILDKHECFSEEVELPWSLLSFIAKKMDGGSGLGMFNGWIQGFDISCTNTNWGVNCGFIYNIGYFNTIFNNYIPKVMCIIVGLLVGFGVGEGVGID